MTGTSRRVRGAAGVGRAALAATALAVGLLLVGCGAPTSATPKSSGPPGSTISSSAAPATVSLPGVLGRAVSLTETLEVHAGSAADSPVTARLSRRTPLGSPRVLLVVGRHGDWLEVRLPIRPNDAIGWVSSADVRLEPVSASVWVNLSARRIWIREDGRPEVDSTVAVGSAENPTPTGLFFVTDRVRPLDRHGAYGGFALGLSAHSDTLSEFRDADGQVGIHGTNDQGSIGLAVSHGCIRVPASVEGALALIPLGTPVLITAR